MPSQFRGDGDEESREVWAVAFVAAAVISMFSTCTEAALQIWSTAVSQGMVFTAWMEIGESTTARFLASASFAELLRRIKERT